MTSKSSEANILISIFNCKEICDLLHNYELAAFEFRNFEDRWKIQQGTGDLCECFLKTNCVSGKL